MTAQKKNPEFAAPGLGNVLADNHSKRALKWKRVLDAFLSGRSFNRFEAERELHDHCLHTTISVLQNKGLVIERRDEIVPGFQGTPTHVTRYWIASESRQKASELLGLPDHFRPVGRALEARV